VQISYTREASDDTKDYSPAAVDYTAGTTGVTIGAITWAQSNIDKSGNFAAYTHSAGAYFKSDEIDNNPCPNGWRVPTLGEFETLLDTALVTNQWTAQNGIYGREFTDKANAESVFFPAQGYSMAGKASASGGENLCGYYWSSTGIDNAYANSLGFNKNNAFILDNNRVYGQPVRCVRVTE